MEVERIKQLEEYFDSILDVLTDGVYISDRSGKTLKVNRTYQQLTGLRPEELIGRYVTDLKAEGKYDVILNPEIVRTGQPKTTVQITKVGRKVVLNGYPVLDEKGMVALVVTFVRDITVLCQIKEQLAQQQELIERYQSQVQFVPKNIEASSLIFQSKEMHALFETLLIIAKTDATALLLGETGCGKGVVARQLHELSTRSTQPFFKIDCTTIPENLFESELFGFEAGAFSGANMKGKPGLVEMAHGGTLFLDEIGELPWALQGKLLRVLQDQEVMRIGSTKVRKVDVRFIAATNRNLHEAVKDGTFRSDLYYRLRVAVLNIPPLRERAADILPLVEYFLAKYGAKYRKSVKLSDSTKSVFERYRWPGNIREMENLIQSLIVTRDKLIIEATDLPNHMTQYEDENKKILPYKSVFSSEKKSLSDIMDELERDVIKQALAHYGSVTKTARALKLDRATIYRKMRRLSLT